MLLHTAQLVPGTMSSEVGTKFAAMHANLAGRVSGCINKILY
jgi:hypothetical protein